MLLCMHAALGVQISCLAARLGDPCPIELLIIVLALRTGGAVCGAVQGDAGDALWPRPAALPVHPRKAGVYGLANAVCEEAVS